MKIVEILKQNKLLLLICLCYFFFRFLFILRLPIFNDESIYLDWAWRELHGAGLFYSLYDAKQPLEMWIFGVFEMLFPDPLFAGRFVSVIAGFITMIGLLKLGEIVWNKQTGYLASMLYIITPLFSFFDRQALMESAITSIAVWTCYTILKFMKTLTIKNAISIGITLGIGELIKSTTSLFTITTIGILGFLLWKYKTPQTAIKFLGIIAATIFVVDLLLIIQPMFWSTLSTNDRFTLSLQELLHFPVLQWITNVSSDSVISFFYLTPVVFFIGILGLFICIRHKKRKELVVAAWFVINLLLQVLVTRNVSQRYLVSFLPILLLFAAYIMTTYIKQWRYVAFAAIASIPFALTMIQILSPATYILALSNVEPFAQPEYVVGITSGYGIDTVRQFMSQQAQKQPIFVGIAENSGNPESALQAYYANNPAITVVYFDRQIMGDEADQYDCIEVQHPLFFISRDEQQAGLNKFLEKLQTIKNPYGETSFGIYTLKQHCRGKVANLQFSERN